LMVTVTVTAAAVGGGGREPEAAYAKITCAGALLNASSPPSTHTIEGAGGGGRYCIDLGGDGGARWL